MLKPNNYDNVQGYGQSVPLPPGGYVCRIRKIANHKSGTGNPVWKVMLEIDEGEYRDYFFDKYTRDKNFNADAQYPSGGIAYVSLYDQNGNAHRSLKTFCLALQESGTNIVWSENDETTFKSIVGQKVGALFGREEFVGRDNKVHWNIKHRLFVPVSDIREGNFQVPEDKRLESSGGGYIPHGYVSTGFDTAPGFEDMPDTFIAAEDDIPF